MSPQPDTSPAENLGAKRKRTPTPNEDETCKHLAIPFCCQSSQRTHYALVDSGATENFIDLRFLARNKLPITKGHKPLAVLMIDGSGSAAGHITHMCHTQLDVGSIGTQDVKLQITKLETFPIVLGMPWLQECNPVIDWKACTLQLGGAHLRATMTVEYDLTTIPPDYHDYADMFSKKNADTLPLH